MLYFNRIDSFEQTDFIKTIESKECNICEYWHFLGKGFNLMTGMNVMIYK